MGKPNIFPLEWDILYHPVGRFGKTTLADVKKQVVFFARHRYGELPGPESERFKSIVVFVDQSILKDRNPPSLSHLYSKQQDKNVEVRTTAQELAIRDSLNLVRLRTVEDLEQGIADRRIELAKHKRQPGADSGVSRKVYRPDMLVVTVGDRKFIIANVLRFDEEVGRLANQIVRNRFAPLMLLGEPIPRKKGPAFYNHVHVGAEVYADSIDETVGLPRGTVLSTEHIFQSVPELPKRLRHR